MSKKIYQCCKCRKFYTYDEIEFFIFSCCECGYLLQEVSDELPFAAPKKCVSGCKHFEGGEVKHHKDCDFYPDSLSKIQDDLIEALKLIHSFSDCGDDYRAVMEIKQIAAKALKKAGYGSW